ncbi:MAG: hypothetical protein IJ661_03085 [Lachnospiraceae bacterium]|nr:hypothetical protein [Lachnospiraceae bacterium]
MTDYTSEYYINAVTNEYQWYSIKPDYHSLKLEQGGDDFFKNMAHDAEKIVYEEDKHIFMKDIQKNNMTRILRLLTYLTEPITLCIRTRKN